MLGGVKVFRRVFVLGRVAAADVPAGHAKAQVIPSVANLQTIFTAFGARCDIANLIEMCALFH